MVCLAAMGVAALTLFDAPRAGAAVVALGAALALVGLWSLRGRAGDTPAPSLVAPVSPESVAEEDGEQAEALLRFAREITHPSSLDQVQAQLARHVPPLVGADRVWIVARLGSRQHVIVPQRGVEGSEGRMLFGSEPADWATFPLRVGAEAVGVLGVDVTQRRLSSRALRAIREISPLIAHALLTAHTMDRLRETSILDPLTGCATRPHGVQRLTAELKRAERTGKGVALLMMDIDHFKAINDRWGHNVGDAVLTALGRTMMQTLRASDVRCRWGGEEFLIVLPEGTVDQARRVAEGLLRRISQTAIEADGASIRVTASIGVTVARPGEHDIEALIARADRAMYRAKAEGRGCVRIVLGDLKGAPIGGSPAPGPLPFRERRDPTRADRRGIPGPGRRRTDAVSEWKPLEDRVAGRSAADRTNPR